MPTLKPVLLTIHQIQRFRPSAPIQEGTYFHTNTLLFISKVPDFTTLIKTKNTEFQAAIQTHHSSLESTGKMLYFTHANKDREYRISSSLHLFYHDFLEKKT